MILSFRHLLEKHVLSEQIFATVNANLGVFSIMTRHGTTVDATLIGASSSTKNKDGKRDPEMHHTKKGNQCNFGIMVHLGVDKDTYLIHSVDTTSANDHDLTPAAELRHVDENLVYADTGYSGISKRSEMPGKPTIFWLALCPGKRRVLPDNADGVLVDLIEKAKVHVAQGARIPFG
jgi:IS5 family transposase